MGELMINRRTCGHIEVNLTMEKDGFIQGKYVELQEKTPRTPHQVIQTGSRRGTWKGNRDKEKLTS